MLMGAPTDRSGAMTGGSPMGEGWLASVTFPIRSEWSSACSVATDVNRFAKTRRHILRSGERFRRLFDEAQGADGMAVKA